MTNINQYFPSCRYHKTLAPKGRMFNTQAEIDEAGEGWEDSPAAFGLVTHPPEQVPGVPQPSVASSPPPSTEPPAEAVPPPASMAKEVKKMNKPELYDLAVSFYGTGEEVPADIEAITKKDLLALVLSKSLPKE